MFTIQQYPFTSVNLIKTKKKLSTPFQKYLKIIFVGPKVILGITATNNNRFAKNASVIDEIFHFFMSNAPHRMCFLLFCLPYYSA